MKTSIRTLNHRWSATITTLLLALLLAPVAHAERPHRGGGAMGQQLHERMTELRSRILRKRVGLDATRIEKVEQILQKGDQERKALHRSVREAHRALRDLIEGDAPDGDAYEAAVGTLLKSRQRLHELQHGELEKLRRVLTPKEMGKLVMALHRLKKRMKRMHERHRQDRRMERDGQGDDFEGRGDRGDREPRERRGRRHRRGGE